MSRAGQQHPHSCPVNDAVSAVAVSADLYLGHPAWLPGYCQAAVYELELLRRYGVTLEQVNLVFAQKVNDTDVWLIDMSLSPLFLSSVLLAPPYTYVVHSSALLSANHHI